MVIQGIKSISNLQVINPYYDTTPAAPTTFRYLRVEFYKRKANTSQTNSLQLSEFRFFYRTGGAQLQWPTSTSVTNPGGNNPGTEGPDKLIDGLTSTKMLDFCFYVPCNTTNTIQTGRSIVKFDLGAGEFADVSGYQWATANDVEGRDPISWNISGSNDDTNWTHMDVRDDQTITASRQTYTQLYSITL